MVHIHGVPILQHLINILPSSIDEVIIVTGYKAEVIQEYFSKHSFDKSIVLLTGDAHLGNWRSLKKAERALESNEKFLLLCGDDMHDKNSLQKLVDIGEESVLAFKHAEPSRFGVVFPNKENYLEDFQEKPENPTSNLISTGVYVLNSDFLKEADPEAVNGEQRLTDVVKEYLKKKKIKVVDSAGWQPIGNPEEFIAAHESPLFDY
jgi:NDP-sugar pyrophosphorylase family protein